MKRIVGVKTAIGIFLALTAVFWVFCGGAFAGDATVTLTRQYYVEDETTISDPNAVQPDKEIALEFSFTNAARTSYVVRIYAADGGVSGGSGDGTAPRPDGTQTVTVEGIPAGQRAEVVFTATDTAGEGTANTYTLRATGTPSQPSAPTSPSGDSGGGGGCSTGFGVGTLMLLTVLALTGKAGKTRR
jgi:hypothetical protein